MLKQINFKNSIRGENIQHNFELIQERLRSESLLTGGKGIIDGIEIDVIDNSRIYLSSGRYVNSEGDEIFFEGGEYRVKSFEPIKRKVTSLKVNALGQAILPHKPYSSFFSAYFTSGYYEYLYPTEDLVIKGTSSNVSIKAVKVENETITLDASEWNNKEVDVEYLYARNRMDTVLITPDRGVVVVTGTMSPSMSHIDLGDYPDAIIVGMLEISINKEITMKVHYTEREERPVHVNKNNELFLNGTQYRRIFFEKPDIPKRYDVYIDHENSDIYSYIEINGELEWVKVNGVSTGIRKEFKIIAPDSDDFPKDNQTFMFNKYEDLKYRFIPNENQVEVIIDNAPLMSDQFEEIIVDNGDLNNGLGIRLKEPLDRPAYVEIRVTHNVQGAKANKAYQRTAVFSKENISYVTDVTNTLFEAAAPYDAGEFQLEVYKEGQRVYINQDYFETDKEGNQVPSGELATHFRFAYDLAIGEEIVSRVTKNIYSYDHIAKVIENSYGSIKDLGDQVNSFADFLELSLAEVDERLFAIEEKDKETAEKLNQMDTFVLKSDTIPKERVDQQITSNTKRGTFEHVVPCESFIDIENLKINDFIMLFKIKGDASTILVKDLDYTLQKSGDNDLIIILDENVVDINASILVKGVKFGI